MSARTSKGVPPVATDNRMNTAFLLMAKYNGRVMLTVDEICRDFFSHLTPIKFLRKTVTGEIKLPVVRMDGSVKAARGVHLSDLADYLDARRDAARREIEAINRH